MVERLQIRLLNDGLNVVFHYSNDTINLASRWLSSISGKSVISRTGFLSIFDALVFGASKILIKGMTFYHSGGHLFRDIVGDLEPDKQHLHKKCSHDSTVELILLKALIEIFQDVFVIDEQLHGLLEK